MKAVDFFAGAGGWTTGAERAGVHVTDAVNHEWWAVQTHHWNHPGTRHHREDLVRMDLRRLQQRPSFLFASPECIGHTRARGKERAYHDESRATAWCVVRGAEVLRPKFLAVENVVEFRSWELFGAWCEALGALGYLLSFHVLNAAEFNVPQDRSRFFILGERGGRRPLEIRSPNLPPVPVGSIIEWDSGTWFPISSRVAATQERVARGRERFGDRFVMPYYGSGSGKTGRSLDRPLGTVPAADVWAAVRGDQMRMLNPIELRRAMGFPDDYVVLGTRADVTRQLGNAVCPPVAEEITRQILRAA